MRLFTYIVAHDTGFSPNPFWNYCTLACCKPVIRRIANKGDWIAGISPKRYNNKLIYAMKVTETPMKFGLYYSDKRFKDRIPDYNNDEIKKRMGDNIYQPLKDGGFIQLESMHSNSDGSENLANKAHDLGGKNVLISDNFYYLGKGSRSLSPPNLMGIIPCRGHRSKFSQEVIDNFVEFVLTLPPGQSGLPSSWREEDMITNEIICRKCRG